MDPGNGVHFFINTHVTHYPGLRIGLALSGRLRQTVLVLSMEDSGNFGVWYPNSELIIYDAEQDQVVEPLIAATAWEAFELFYNWHNCNPMLK